MSDKVAFQVRLDAKTHAQLKEISEKELRSINAQLEYFIKLGIEWYKNNPPRIEG